jgi:hypothetical protein
MRHYVGFDVGKGAHWACVLDEEGEMILSRRVEATEEALEVTCKEIAALGGVDERVLGIDLTGGPAALLETVLLGRGEKVRYVPGTTVNKAREAYPGGEQKSDKGTPSSISRPAEAPLEVSLGGSPSGGENSRTAGFGRPPEGPGAGADPARDPA